MPTWVAVNSPSARDKRDRMWIRRLRDLNCFDELIRQLAEGESLSIVARWVMGLKIEGETSQWSFLTWRRYLQVLSTKVRQDLPRVEKSPKLTGPELQAVTEELKRQQPDEEIDPIAPAARPVWAKVREAVQKIDAATALKYAFVTQQARVEEILALEKKIPMMIMGGAGAREITVLKDIAEGLRKLEIGEQWMRGKGGEMPYCGPYPGGLLPQEPDKEESDFAKRFAELSPVDKNLFINAVESTITLAEMKAEAETEARAENEARANRKAADSGIS